MLKRSGCLFLLILIVLTFSINAYSQQTSPLSTIRKNPPFLITRGLPHFIGTLKANWNNPKFGFTQKQKKELRRVERDTINSLLRITRRISKLENYVIKSVRMGVEPYKLHNVINKIAKLKAEATEIHLRCLYDIHLILTEKQMTLLKQTLRHKKNK